MLNTRSLKYTFLSSGFRTYSRYTFPKCYIHGWLHMDVAGASSTRQERGCSRPPGAAERVGSARIIVLPIMIRTTSISSTKCVVL